MRPGVAGRATGRSAQRLLKELRDDGVAHWVRLRAERLLEAMMKVPSTDAVRADDGAARRDRGVRNGEAAVQESSASTPVDGRCSSGDITRWVLEGGGRRARSTPFRRGKSGHTSDDSRRGVVRRACRRRAGKRLWATGRARPDVLRHRLREARGGAERIGRFWRKVRKDRHVEFEPRWSRGHVQVQTESKMFCACPARYRRRAELERLPSPGLAGCCGSHRARWSTRFSQRSR